MSQGLLLELLILFSYIEGSIVNLVGFGRDLEVSISSNKSITGGLGSCFRAHSVVVIWVTCKFPSPVPWSLLGQKILDYQLNKIGLFTSSEFISQHSDFHRQLKILWANHGDEISLQYSGTHALKGDFVRYGRQTVSGLIKDGFSALARYYLNNFHDGIRQDAMDLVAGYYTVSRGIPSPFQLNGFELFAYLPIASALIVGALTITTFSLRQAADDTQHFLYSVVWGGLTAGVMAIVKANGRQFCSRPRLCKLF